MFPTGILQPEASAELKSYLSPAPQAEPQAAGFSSGLSEAPQADPQAVGFSAGSSAAPQADPQAEATFSSFHPAKLERAIVLYLPFRFRKHLSPVIASIKRFSHSTSTHNFVTLVTFW